MQHRISIIGINNCSASALMGTIDFFRAANVILKHISNLSNDTFEFQIVTLDGRPIQCANSYSISIDGNLSSVQPGDIVFCLPFSMDSPAELIQHLGQLESLSRWLKKHIDSFDLIVAVSGGVFLLAEAGLLEGKETTTDWWFDAFFKQRYPNVKVNNKSICVQDKNIVSAGAYDGWRDASMFIMEKYLGRNTAKIISRIIMRDYEQRSMTPNLFISPIQTEDVVVNNADIWIQKNLNRNISIKDIADHISVSPRTLIRHFKTALGESPLTYVQKSRVEKCKLLLEISDMTFSEIVYHCGYTDVSSFRRLFKKHCLVTPTEYRRAIKNKKTKH